MKLVFYITAFIGFIIWVITLGAIGSYGHITYDSMILGVGGLGTIKKQFAFRGWLIGRQIKLK